MDTNLYELYALLTGERDKIEKKLDGLKLLIIEDMAKNGKGSVTKPFGTFSIRKTAKYEYSDEIEALEDMLGQAKEDERDRGIAKVTEVETLRFQAPKEKKAKKK